MSLFKVWNNSLIASERIASEIFYISVLKPLFKHRYQVVRQVTSSVTPLPVRKYTYQK